jgi:hypothetical protein
MGPCGGCGVVDHPLQPGGFEFRCGERCTQLGFGCRGPVGL